MRLGGESFDVLMYDHSEEVCDLAGRTVSIPLVKVDGAFEIFGCIQRKAMTFPLLEFRFRTFQELL